MTAMTTLRHAFLLACLSLPASLAAQQPPGYDGTFPSERAQQALRDTMTRPWQDEQKVLGGGEWQLTNGGVTPQP